MSRFVFLASVLIAGCAHAPASMRPESVLDDTLFPAASSPIDREAIFALSPEMQAYLVQHESRLTRGPDAREALLNALRQDIRLDYDATVTRTASEAFDARSGNFPAANLAQASAG